MLQRVRDLPSFVTTQSGTAANYTATFKDYFTLDLPLPAAYRQQLFNAQDIIEELAGIQDDLIERRGDVEYILAHPNSFEDVTPQKIAAMQAHVAQINDYMTRIYHGARACYRDFRACKMPPDVAQIPQLELPKRKVSLQTLVRDVVAVKTSLEQIDIGELDGPLNDPDCYLEVRAVAPDGQYKRLRRTETDFTDPRCDQLSKELLLPIALIEESFRGLGTDPANGQLEVLVRDDDPGENDAIIGRLAKPYAQIRQQQAVLDTLTGPYVTMGVGFEVR
jgi:hypothetical protein